jgi:SHS2 domain-containing protein
MPNPADRLGIESISTATWHCWICANYGGKHIKSWSSTVGRCKAPEHRRHVSLFLDSSSSHAEHEQRSVITILMDSRINMLLCAADRREIHELLYLYWRSNNDVRNVFARLDFFEHKDRIVLSMLAAWKYLAQSRADEEPVDARHIKKARTLRDMWLEHRNDWKLHKQAVFDAGQVCLVGNLVRPFLEIVDSVKLVTS